MMFSNPRLFLISYACTYWSVQLATTLWGQPFPDTTDVVVFACMLAAVSTAIDVGNAIRQRRATGVSR